MKSAGNYAPTLMIQMRAHDSGCDQVLWLDAAEHKLVEELGGMNIFFFSETASSAIEVWTPARSPTILEGVTMSSIESICAALQISVSKRRIAWSEVMDHVAAGQFTGAFACGTAAGIVPIRRFVGNFGELALPSDFDDRTQRALAGIHESLRAAHMGEGELGEAWGCAVKPTS